MTSLSTRIESVISAYYADESDIDEMVEVLKECKVRIAYDEAMSRMISRLSKTVDDTIEEMQSNLMGRRQA